MGVPRDGDLNDFAFYNFLSDVKLTIIIYDHKMLLHAEVKSRINDTFIVVELDYLFQ